VNELDDERAALEDDLRSVEERIDSVAPFADLGLDLDLLSGYDSLQVAVGHGDAEDIRAELDASDAVEAYEVFEGDETVGVFVYPRDGNPEALDDALVGVDFARLEIPDAEGRPEAYLDDLRAERRDVEADLERVDERTRRAPQRRARRLPAGRRGEALHRRPEDRGAAPVRDDGPRVRRRGLDSPPRSTRRSRTRSRPRSASTPPWRNSSRRTTNRRNTTSPRTRRPRRPPRTTVTLRQRPPTAGRPSTSNPTTSPPVVQDNPGPVKPFEALTEVINRPKYTEIDPTVILFLTFPAFYGFMIGDLGYGILYTAIGYWLYAGFDSDMINKLGGVAMLAGIATAIFGVLYGEFFGLHLITEYLWHGVVGLEDAPMKKGSTSAPSRVCGSRSASSRAHSTSSSRTCSGSSTRAAHTA